MKIKFKHLKTISERDEDYLIQYLNRFPGKNVFEKFENILKNWERDVSYHIGFNINGKDVKIQLSYVLNELKNYDKESILVENDVISVVADVPSNFKKDHTIFSLFSFIKQMKYLNFDVNFEKLNDDEKNIIMENLPAPIYNFLAHGILKNNNKIILFNNPALNNMTIDFMGTSPLEMLKGLFYPYNKDYYLDVIYHLSQKIGGEVLMNSTIQEIDYYINKLNDEQKEGNIPNLS